MNELGQLNNKFSLISKDVLAYIAGFLDGDGCILAQIVRGSDYRYKHTIRVSVTFYQKKSRHWFVIWLKSQLKGVGWIRIKKDGMCEYTITAFSDVEKLLKVLLPFLRLKRPAAVLVLKIIEALRVVKTEVDFIKVCQLVDEIADYTDSKKRVISALVVKNLILPVETQSN